MDQTDTKINKVMNFVDSSYKTVKMPDCFRLFGPKGAPLSRNRVNVSEDNPTNFESAGSAKIYPRPKIKKTPPTKIGPFFNTYV